MKPIHDPWSWRDRGKAIIIIGAMLYLLWHVLSADAAPLTGGGEGYCYGAAYSVTVTDVTVLMRGMWWVTVETNDGGVYSLPTTRWFKVGQSRTLQGLVCEGLGFSASRLK